QEAGCCGALAHHLNDHAASHAAIKKNIDSWWPHIEAGAEAIVVTASGCGTMVADYGHVLRNDTEYAEKAKRVSELFCDASTMVMREQAALTALLAKADAPTQNIAFHSPCRLHHGLKIRGGVEALLHAAGYELTSVPDGHLCCGSAGTYSILQPELSAQLLKNKVAALESGQPEGVATANIGCLAHIESGLKSSSKLPIRHWVEWLEAGLPG
ncbi:MAG: glycolate oxidase subunit GlcF, partial [Betaproteobacteria bacterium]|nr:glycolate oxidase subunit GlcF [Betaproteobacteria bacterium]